MKKFLSGALILTGIILLAIYGCDKEDEVQYLEDKTSNSLVYEDLSLKDEVSPYFYDNHIFRIEQLGENQERREVEAAARENGVDMECLQLSELQKYYFNHTSVRMYSIPTNDPEQSVILYESHGLYQVSLAEFRPSHGQRTQYNLKSLDDQPYLSFQLDQENRIGEIVVNDNKNIKSFNDEIYFITLDTSHGKSTQNGDAECCRKESSWKACLSCTLDDCDASLFCRVTSMVIGAPLAASFMVSCIGAGPDANC